MQCWRDVFKTAFKIDKSLRRSDDSARLFQTVGPATEKARSPNWVRGTMKSRLLIKRQTDTQTDAGIELTINVTYKKIGRRNFKHFAEISECCRCKCFEGEIAAVVCRGHAASLTTTHSMSQQHVAKTRYLQPSAAKTIHYDTQLWTFLCTYLCQMCWW